MNYPSKSVVIETLTAVARRAAEESSANHPEDIADAMVTAIEYAASTLTVLNGNNRLK